MGWAESELATINLGDQRLNKRAMKLLGRLGGKPSETIPSACRGWSETKAAYRFFNHENVTADQILVPHKHATLKRMELHETVLLIQDTTQLNYSSQKEKKGIGPLNRDNHTGVFTASYHCGNNRGSVFGCH